MRKTADLAVWALVATIPILAHSGCARAEGAGTRGSLEPVVGLPCEGCEAVFEGIPEEIPSVARIAPPGEPGEPLRIEGTIHDPEGRPAPGVIVYAYHTDARGIYPRAEHPPGRAAARHGRLRAWARSDARGRYRFDTIRPASYPNTEIEAHVHMHVIEPGRCTYYIADIHFDDDPLLTADEKKRMATGRGGPGLATPRKDESGTWAVVRDIRLGEGVPGYPERENR